MEKTETINIRGKNWILTPLSVAESRTYLQLCKEFEEILESGAAKSQDAQNFAEGLAKLIHASIGRVDPTITMDEVESLNYAEIIAASKSIRALAGAPDLPPPSEWKVN